MNKKIGHEKNQLPHLISKIKSSRKKPTLNLSFNIFAKKISDIVGNALAFIVAVITVLIWAILGHHFHFSDTWQLVINTGTTIITFLVVFLIQNTQNRDTSILNLKLDEIIHALKSARNELIDLHELSDVELKELEKEYRKIKNRRTGS